MTKRASQRETAAGLAALAALSLLLHAGSDASAAPRYQNRPLPGDVRIDRIVIFKTAHRLEAYRGTELLKTYSVAVGAGGAGPKTFAGDNKTPEGTYRVTGRHPSGSYHRFIALSYPNDDDRRRYAQLRKRGEVPRSTGIGGSIGIHGERTGLSWLPHKLVDWTRGCIAVDDQEIDELYRAVTDGARVEIRR